MNQNAFDNFALYDNKYQIEIDNYLPTQKNERSAHNDDDGNREEYLIYKEANVPTVMSPRISLWEYLEKSDVQTLLELERKSQIRKFIEEKLNRKVKGLALIIFRELIYTANKFCKTSRFNLEQTGAVLSQFYLTHLFFTSSPNVGAEKLYAYFRELQLRHSLPFPPQSIKLFSLEEIKKIMIYFCKLYLRNLPIIHFMSLPNFTLCAKYPLKSEIELGSKKKKGGKGKKRKKEG